MKCLGFLFHDWGRWADVRQGKVLGRTDSKKDGTVGFFIDQERRCAKCGKVQLRTAQQSL